jgi:predicted GNAT family N-acyltransferase
MINLHLGVVVSDATIRRHFTELLRSFEQTAQLQKSIPQVAFEIVAHPSPEHSADLLQQHFRQEGDCAAVVLSDRLEEEIGSEAYPNPEPSQWAKDLRDTFKQKPFASIAITPHHRIPDIDRTVPPDCRRDQWLNTLRLTVEKLLYLDRPKIKRLKHPIVIREIGNRETEMMEYFRLRHRIYNVMGYIDADIERAPSRMEINRCDKYAIHIGAFERVGTREKLIGTARVMHTGSLESPCSRYVTALADQDPVLKLKMQEAMTMRLPVFQSMRSARMNQLFSDTLTAEKECGELSRVIVAQRYRGMGLANLLVKFAVFQANRHNVDPLLLECLPIHERFYNRFGFQKIEGEEGRVIGVEQSMIAMALHPVATQDFVSGAEVVVEKARLCACRHRECYGETYRLYRTRECPLRSA